MHLGCLLTALELHALLKKRKHSMLSLVYFFTL